LTARALVGLGGNIGDPAAAMRAALQALDARGEVRVRAVSRLFRTPPWGKVDQPDFLNAAAAVETSLSPRELLDACLAIERDLKRERRERWGPRTVDLDVLDYAGLRCEDAALTLPHPRMAERAFVLAPLADIAPEFVLGRRSIGEVLATLDRAGIEPTTGDGSWWLG
jgi:2-amino-4-hydroxy-6-hydroxymethyldihydropteridine diphosphokinase